MKLTDRMNPSSPFLVIYFDEGCHSKDGSGWCVETSDSEMTVRFGTLAGALAYAQAEEGWLRNHRQKETA